MESSALPLRYYVEAPLCAVYLYNRCTHSGHDTSPYEQLTKWKPRVPHLRPFGCIAYAYIPPEKRTKLDASSEKCRLLGKVDDFSSQEVKGYKLLRESDMSIFYLNDVKFIEDAVPDELEVKIDEPYVLSLSDMFSDDDDSFVAVDENSDLDEDMSIPALFSETSPEPLSSGSDTESDSVNMSMVNLLVAEEYFFLL